MVKTMSRVRVLLFASYREMLGRGSMDVEIPKGATMEQLFDDLVSVQPRLAELRPFTAFALNREVVEASAVLEDGDEVALLQPVSGGCRD